MTGPTFSFWLPVSGYALRSIIPAAASATTDAAHPTSVATVFSGTIVRQDNFFAVRYDVKFVIQALLEGGRACIAARSLVGLGDGKFSFSG